LKKVYTKHKEIIDYLIWGVAAWLLYMILIWLFTEKLEWNPTASTIIDNFLVINFAFFTNKFLVFRSKTNSFKAFGREYINFFIARLATMVISTLLVWIFSDLLKYNKDSFVFAKWATGLIHHVFDKCILRKISDGMIVQLVTQVIVIISNYILSKLWIFNNKKEKETKSEGLTNEDQTI